MHFTLLPNPLLSKGIGQCRSLVTLILLNCKKLGSLPEGLCTIDPTDAHTPYPPFTLNHPCTINSNRYSPKHS